MSYSLNKSPLFRICLACCFSVLAYAQQPPEPSDLTSQGVSLYEHGETDNAVKTLREAIKKSRKDTKAWHYLGLGLIRKEKAKEARNAFERRVTSKAGRARKPLALARIVSGVTNSFSTSRRL